MPYCYDYPRPMVTADIMVFSPSLREPAEILLIQRKHPPFEGMWAFPGGYLDENESLEDCAMRELREETGLRLPLKGQFRTVSTPGRDPRGHTITTVFVAEASQEALKKARAGDDAAALCRFPLHALPPLAFDHGEILKAYLETLHKEAPPENALDGEGSK